MMPMINANSGTTKLLKLRFKPCMKYIKQTAAIINEIAISYRLILPADLVITLTTSIIMPSTINIPATNINTDEVPNL